ncbi:hypothetical protein [Hydrogenophaga sp. MI9]|uniref:hypothetical protein n=1 Tax=Hydrogenophaga sp. MI9 TaxID=3453719 RepID=UPI003EEED368
MLKIIIALTATLSVSGCLFDSPGQQCLNSFKQTLKDPNSGKVLEFNESKLTYSATNSYGARLQGNALCAEENGKWVRDLFNEEIAILNRMAEKLEASNNCRRAGGSREDCAGDSAALKYGNSDQNELKEEVRRELGFN